MTEPRPRRVSEAAPARVYGLGEEPADDLSTTTSAAERVEMVALLTRRALELAGKPWPSLPRAEWPVTIVRPR